MRSRIQTCFPVAIALALMFCLQTGSANAQPVQVAKPASVVRAEKFFRTELYFGRSIPGGGDVSNDDWNRFLADVVTPRFPDGFTTLKAMGHYREKSGKIVTEPSEVLIIYYAGGSKNESRAKIEEIRAAYVTQFKQESVLRIDLPKTVRVSF